ncbi:DUF4179 domain-containing protein [Natronolimnobius sp. AArcel1]|uniref:DUF7282 domain-containing protein n=1 Tax=Natronolimnobius sp. AArcel1 TaxID=1679093 RepID=UPI0013EAD389|nr:DUF4179 domain-containing protein [Natronolimnobius sp. AArcel1]NGM68809.1 DUF4179 domain-containing protein [Natronolimnobius sp. AArcel1]
MSSRSTLGTIKRVAAILIAIAIVLAAGILVGQAPAIFGVEEDPEASLAFEDQDGDGTNVTVDNVSLSEGGFVVISDSQSETLAVSEYLEDGSHDNVTIDIEEDDEPVLIGRLTATVHQDTSNDDTYAYDETDGEEDRPYLEDGFPVSDTATVTTTDDGDVTDSFEVDSVDVPSTATTNETVEVVAEISNPTDFQTQQPVDFRVDGTVLEQQMIDLEPGEVRNVTFEVDTAGTEPGNQTYGVYTEADGSLHTVELEFHATPSVTVTDATEDSVTVDAAIPEDGFVAIEDNETLRGTSESLEFGEHENVTIDLEEPPENVTIELEDEDALEEDDELTALLYSGDPDDYENESPIEYNDEPVETTFTLEEAMAADDDETDEADAADDSDTGDDGDDADGDDTDD